MIGVLLQESIEITWIAAKLILRGAKHVYRYFVPIDTTEHTLMIELQTLRDRVERLENET
jgi:hypothetical protein